MLIFPSLRTVPSSRRILSGFFLLVLLPALSAAQTPGSAARAPAVPANPAPVTVSDSARATLPIAPSADSASVAADSLPALSSTAPDSAAPVGGDSSQAASPAPGPAEPSASPEPVLPEPAPRVFDDYPLLGKEYLAGTVGAGVTGMIGFYVAKAFEGLFRENESDVTGHLSFTGVRYDNFSGAFWGGASGLALGSAVGAYWLGSVDEEDGSFLWTLLASSAATAGAIGLANALGANEEHGWPALVPLLALPPLGAVAGFNVSRYFRDAKRERLTRENQARAPGLRVLGPSLALSSRQGTTALSLQAVQLRF